MQDWILLEFCQSVKARTFYYEEEKSALRLCQKKAHNPTWNDPRVDFSFRMHVLIKWALQLDVVFCIPFVPKDNKKSSFTDDAVYIYTFSVFYIITQKCSAFLQLHTVLERESYGWCTWMCVTTEVLLFCSFPTPLTLVHPRLHLKMGFKVHVGWTQLATFVAVETRLTHGQVVENSGSGSLRGYRDLSRFMDFTVQT